MVNDEIVGGGVIDAKELDKERMLIFECLDYLMGTIQDTEKEERIRKEIKNIVGGFKHET